MPAKLRSFINIFNAIENGEEIVKKIKIPIIQRDYAQGRKNSSVTRIRRDFLNALYNAIVTKTSITLDFVYGDVKMDGVLVPLDGQQRLTTLFLLHWYAAKKEDVTNKECQFLKNFSYETRPSARDFCNDLIDFKPKFNEDSLSKEIINQVWFPFDWKKDPTISSMLVMLDAIDDKFKNVNNIWNALKNDAITFYFLPIKDMGLTDDLYIKMNSRGKPLTTFEHFKAELSKRVSSINEGVAKELLQKIDNSWTDLLWEYRNSGTGADDDNVIDDEFLRYFKFICDVICYRQGRSTIGRSNDEFDLLDIYFLPDSNDISKNKEVLKNIETMEKFFDCWCDIPKKDFFNSFMSKEHTIGKILVDDYKLNIFEDCLHSYSDRTGKIRNFPLNRMVLLYAITIYLQNRDKIKEEDFARRIRIINNLIQNSENEISDRLDRNRMQAILAQTDAIILTGNIDDSIKNSFNQWQLEEEKKKISFLKDKSAMADTLFELEDHFLLKGQISIIGLDNLNMAYRFKSLFNCKFDRIDCALMALGDYGQLEDTKGRYQYGSSTMQSAWKNLFHQSANKEKEFENTNKILITLLSKNETFTDDILNQIANNYIKDCEDNNKYTFQYYYIKYKEYRPGKYGKLSNSNKTNNPYLFSVLATAVQLSENSYMPFLKAADNTHISREDYGQKLIYGDEYICCTNNSYVRKKKSDNSVVDEILINQNEKGIDTEDRIIKLKKYIEQNFPKT